jgi:hypothetical protein
MGKALTYEESRVTKLNINILTILKITFQVVQMKNNKTIKNTIIYCFLALTALVISTKLATSLYDNTVVVNGVLGATNLYFIYLLFLSRGFHTTSRLFESKIDLPSDIKFIFLSFILWIIIYWSARYVITALTSATNLIR